MNSMAGDAAEFYAKFPDKVKYKKIQQLRLPTKGPIPFVPPASWTTKANPPTRNGAYVDAYGYEWRWHQAQGEWDVQLANGKGGTEYFGKDNGHANISPEGRVTH